MHPIPAPHDAIEIQTTSQVTTVLVDPFVAPSAPPRPLAPIERHDYLATSRLIPHEEQLVDLAGHLLGGVGAQGLQRGADLLQVAQLREQLHVGQRLAPQQEPANHAQLAQDAVQVRRRGAGAAFFGVLAVVLFQRGAHDVLELLAREGDLLDAGLFVWTA